MNTIGEAVFLCFRMLDSGFNFMSLPCTGHKSMSALSAGVQSVLFCLFGRG